MFKLRPSSAEDVESIARINTHSWQNTYRGIVDQGVLDSLKPEDQFPRVQKRLLNPELKSLVAVNEETGKVVGYADFGPCREKNIDADGELYAIYLDESVKGKKIGRKLFEEGYAYLKAKGYKKMMVSVLEENKPARRFYEKMGGKFVGNDKVDLKGVFHRTSTYVWIL